MEYLEALEKKILQVVDRSKQLESRVGALTKENESLFKANKELEVALMNETNKVKRLADERGEAKDVIDGLLETLSSVEKASGS